MLGWQENNLSLLLLYEDTLSKNLRMHFRHVHHKLQNSYILATLSLIKASFAVVLSCSKLSILYPRCMFFESLDEYWQHMK